MRPAQYLVIERTDCPNCKRTGYIPNPEWHHFIRELQNWSMRPTDRAAPNVENMKEKPLNIPCPTCGGKQTLENLVDLNSVLQQLGYYPAIETPVAAKEYEDPFADE